MHYRYLGRSGLQVSALSLGSWVTYGNQVGEDVADRCMRAAWDAGVNFFDSAEVYAAGQAEAVMGSVLRKMGLTRSEYVVSTKIFWGGKLPNQRGLSRKHLVEGTDAALVRMKLDYVDLLFCHRPDPRTPMEEIVWTMTQILNRGKALYWGTSEWSAQEITEAHLVAEREHLMAPLMEQPEYNMFHRERVEREYQPLYERYGLGTTIWSPLAGGILTGKYNDGVPAGSRATVAGMEWYRSKLVGPEATGRVEKVRELIPVAKELDCSLPQLALAWCLANPNVSTVIMGASKAEQVKDNLRALDVVPKLDAAIMAQIDAVLDNRPQPEAEFR